MFIVWLIRLLSGSALIGKKYTIEKINREGLEPPYMVLSNHMYFIDLELAALITTPHRVNDVINLDGYCRRPRLMELIGAIGTRKFTMELHLIKSIAKVLKRGDVMCMHPEARCSPCGTFSYIPEAVGKLIRMNKMPVVAIVHHGNHLHSPFRNFRKKRKVPLHTTATQILTAEQAATLPAEEINAIVRKALWYDDCRCRKENGTYRFEDDADMYSQPRCWRFIHPGPAHRTHDAENGFALEGFYRGKPCRVQRQPHRTNSLHVEYDCCIKPFDCVDVSAGKDSFFCYPATKTDVVTKMAFATETIYQMKCTRRKAPAGRAEP